MQSMRHQIALLRLSVLVVFFTASGATCNRQLFSPFGQTGPAAPQVLSPGAQVDQIAAAINANTARVQSFSAPAATITIPNTTMLPPLRGNIAVERPQRFRLTAGTGITGQEVDLGSNDELFWLWVRRGQPPGVFLCRHHQFAGSAAHRVMPIEPRWLQSALGLTELDPASVYEGPLPHGENSVELRTYLPTADGTLHRVLVIDTLRGWVLEQHVYDAAGTTLIASAVAQSHRYYPLEQVSLPERVAIRLPTAQLTFTIDLGQVQINQPAASGNLWTMPAFEGYQQFDLGTAPAGAELPFGGLTGTPAQSTISAGALSGLPLSGVSPSGITSGVSPKAASQMNPMANIVQPPFVQPSGTNAWHSVPNDSVPNDSVPNNSVPDRRGIETAQPSVYSAGVR